MINCEHSDPLAERLAELQALTREPNWNDECDEAIPESEWASARAFLQERVRPRLAGPHHLSLRGWFDPCLSG